MIISDLLKLVKEKKFSYENSGVCDSGLDCESAADGEHDALRDDSVDGRFNTARRVFDYCIEKYTNCSL